MLYSTGICKGIGTASFPFFGSQSTVYAVGIWKVKEICSFPIGHGRGGIKEKTLMGGICMYVVGNVISCTR